MPDHKHICAQCGDKWECMDYTKEQCVSKGVIKAVQVNRAGPWCLLCLHVEMAHQFATYRKLPKIINLLTAAKRQLSDE